MTECLKKYNIEPKGIFHVGIHEGQEIPEYLQIGFKRIYAFDANEDYIKALREQYKGYPNIIFKAAAVSDTSGTIEFNITNNGQSSSILPLGQHADIYPDIVYIDKRTVPCTTLNHVNMGGINVINLDIQGAELKALKGADMYLNDGKIDMIYTEINLAELYQGCCLKHEIDEYLAQFGFVCKEQFLAHPTWGDAVYIKE
jgi:FkbM family methyltransferase